MNFNRGLSICDKLVDDLVFACIQSDISHSHRQATHPLLFTPKSYQLYAPSSSTTDSWYQLHNPSHSTSDSCSEQFIYFWSNFGWSSVVQSKSLCQQHQSHQLVFQPPHSLQFSRPHNWTNWLPEPRCCLAGFKCRWSLHWDTEGYLSMVNQYSRTKCPKYSCKQLIQRLDGPRTLE